MCSRVRGTYQRVVAVHVQNSFADHGMHHFCYVSNLHPNIMSDANAFLFLSKLSNLAVHVFFRGDIWLLLQAATMEN